MGGRSPGAAVENRCVSFLPGLAIGLRVAEAGEEIGRGLAEHNERAYSV